MKSQRAYVEHAIECIRRIAEDSAQGGNAVFASRTLRTQLFATFRFSANRRRGLTRRTKSGTPKSTGRRLPACETYWCTTILKWTLRQFGMLSLVISLSWRRQCVPSWLGWTSHTKRNRWPAVRSRRLPRPSPGGLRDHAGGAEKLMKVWLAAARPMRKQRQ